MKALRLSLTLLFVLISGLLTASYATAIMASTFGWDATDATTAFQSAINSTYDTVIVDKQTGDWIVRPNIFTNISNKTIIFQSGVVLLAKPGAFTGANDCLLEFINGNNIKIYGYGATLKMQKAEYTTGEWRSCIWLIDCSNMEIYGLIIRDSGGDGIFLHTGWTNPTPRGYCENILLKDLWCDNNRRQGISVISAQHLRVENCWFTNTKGTAPQAGVDLEPDLPTERLVDIVFNKCRFTGNSGPGILVAAGMLDSSSLPVSFTFSNCYINGTVGNIAIALVEGDDNRVGGTATFENCMTENNQIGISVGISKTDHGYKAFFNNCVFKGAQVAIRFYDSFSAGWPRYGGATFSNCLISNSSTDGFVDNVLENGSTGSGDVQFNNVTVINPNPAVTYSVGTPSSNCVFDFHKFTLAPATTVSYSAGTSLIECTPTNSILNTTRAAGSNVTYPLGISYSIKGSGVQGIDYSLMSGFEIIPQGSYSATDTFLVLKDDIAEPVKHDTVTIDTSSYYSTTSSPQNIVIEDCISTGIVENAIVKMSPIRLFVVEMEPSSNRLSIRFAGELKPGSTIQLYDSKGERIVDLTNRFRNHCAVWNTSSRAAGVYVVKLKNTVMEYGQKIIMVR